MLRACFHRLTTTRTSKQYRRSTNIQPARLRLELLEDRTAPAVVAELNGTILQVSITADDTADHVVRLQQDIKNPATETDVLDAGQVVGTFANSALTQISVKLGAGNDTLDLGDVLKPSSGIGIDGGAGNNTLVNSMTKPNTALKNDWQITGANAGTVNGIAYSNIANLSGTVKSVLNVFDVETGGSVSGTVSGHWAYLAYGDYGATVKVTVKQLGANGYSGTATAIGGGFTGLGKVKGSASYASKLIGPNVDTIWSISDANAGTLYPAASSISKGLTFTLFNKLAGGTGNDTFAFESCGSISSTIAGGSGDNTLDYSAFGAVVGVSLAVQSSTASSWFSGTATATGGFAQIEHLIGSNSVNSLTGPNLKSVWTLAGTNAGSLVATGKTLSYSLDWKRFANLNGGTANDTFQFIGAALVTGHVHGGSGYNTLDYAQANYATKSSIAYSDFSSTSGLSFNNSELVPNPAKDIKVVTTGDGKVLQLGPGNGTGSESYSVFANSLVSTTSFSTDFQFRMTGRGGVKDPSGGVGADGLVFVLQNSSPRNAGTGGAGGNLGFQNRFSDSIGVAFDTWQNTGNNDPSSNSLGIDFNGSVVHTSTNGAVKAIAPNFDDGNIWHAWIDYDGTTLRIYTAEGTGAVKPSTPTLAQNVDLPHVVGSPFAFPGLTSANGAGWEVTRLVNWHYSSSTTRPENPGVLVDFDAPTSPTMSATGIGTGFNSIQNVIGSAGANYLRGDGTWTISGTDSGTLVSAASPPAFKAAFSGFQNLEGTAKTSTFAFTTGSITGSITGGRGTNWLDYSAYGAPVTVDLSNGSATGVAGGAASTIANIQNVIGSNLGNTLTGNGKSSILVGGAGADTIAGGGSRSILIGGAGNDVIADGSGQDILIAGTVNFGANLKAALQAILTEWRRTDESYAQQISNIRTGVGTNHAYQLVWGTTVLDDGGSNELDGNASASALDWFFANLAANHDVIDHLNALEVVN